MNNFEVVNLLLMDAINKNDLLKKWSSAFKHIGALIDMSEAYSIIKIRPL